jgi:hypothetical protein
VEKAAAKIKIARDSLSLLLIAQNRCSHPGRQQIFLLKQKHLRACSDYFGDEIFSLRLEIDLLEEI